MHESSNTSMTDVVKQLSEINDQLYTTNILLMRLYDLTMLQAQEIAKSADDMYKAHAAGKVVGPIPYIDMPDWAPDE